MNVLTLDVYYCKVNVDFTLAGMDSNLNFQVVPLHPLFINTDNLRNQVMVTLKMGSLKVLEGGYQVN